MVPENEREIVRLVNYSLSSNWEYLVLNDKIVYIAIIDDIKEGNFDLYRECDEKWFYVTINVNNILIY